VHKAIVDNIYVQSNDYDHGVFSLPDFAGKLIEQGKLGVKTKEGFFKTSVKEDKTKEMLVYDIESGALRPLKKYSMPFAAEMISHMHTGNYEKAMQALKDNSSHEALVCRHFLVSYITYSLTTAKQVSPNFADADIAMSTGFNWIGPLALVKAVGGYGEVIKMAEKVDFDGNLVSQLKKIDKKEITPPPFDYRKYLRAVL
jgi:3-hydroxyacyl-CoA dehydrogenase